MADFVDGVWIDTVETKYGDIIKQNFDVDKFIKFLQSSEHIKIGNDGRKYLNTEIKKSRSGKHYMAVDTWKPEPQDGGNPFDKSPSDIPDDVPF